MPGRLCMYKDISFKEEVFKKLGGFNDTIGVISPQYNIAPTLNIAIYTSRHLYTYAHFGLIPSWADSRSKMQINARSESVYEKSSFKKTILTCALLTTQPNKIIEALHDRMPVILESDQWEPWLNEQSSYSELNKLFIPIASEKINYFRVGELVNSVKNNTQECIKEATEISVPRQGTLF